jgi:glycosyltransferase involved in cell wall biosynthesis
MKILITTGLSESDMGGPFQYAPRLKDEFEKLGHMVEVVAYGKIEKALPTGLRHIYFFLKILPICLSTNYVLTLDTFSVGVPSIWAAKICGKKSIIRVGGDSLWSAYVNRTSHLLTLPNFYEQRPKLNTKERIIRLYMGHMIENANYLAFNTEWQRGIWSKDYKIPAIKSGVVRNFIPDRSVLEAPESKKETKNFLWAGRAIPEKNLSLLKRVGNKVATKHPEFRLDIITGEVHQAVLRRIKGCHVAISLAFSDICPNFIIEGVAYNKPFIMTRETGLNEIFPKGGIFVDPMDEKEIEAALEALLNNSAYNTYIEELKNIKIKHSWSEIARDFLNIWENL